MRLAGSSARKGSGTLGGQVVRHAGRRRRSVPIQRVKKEEALAGVSSAGLPKGKDTFFVNEFTGGAARPLAFCRNADRLVIVIGMDLA